MNNPHAQYEATLLPETPRQKLGRGEITVEEYLANNPDGYTVEQRQEMIKSEPVLHQELRYIIESWGLTKQFGIERVKYAANDLSAYLQLCGFIKHE